MKHDDHRRLRGFHPRRLLGLAALAVCAAAPFGSATSQPPAQGAPLPEGYVRQGPPRHGAAPKMVVTERAAEAKVFELRFSAGDEILSGLYDLVAAKHIASGHITGIGGLSGALLGWGDPANGAFKKIVVDAKTEIVSVLGDVSERNGEPYVHVHMVVGYADGSTKAGHVLEAHVAPLAEVSVVATSFAR